jgi:hypothetical protein
MTEVRNPAHADFGGHGCPRRGVFHGTGTAPAAGQDVTRITVARNTVTLYAGQDVLSSFHVLAKFWFTASAATRPGTRLRPDTAALRAELAAIWAPYGTPFAVTRRPA